MPTLPLKTFDQLVSDQQAAVQASNPRLANMKAGSMLLSLIEANAGVGLYMQYLIFQALRNTRMQTSEGADLDSFGGQFLFGRYPSVAATGLVLFTRFVALRSASVPVGAVLRTIDGSLTFQVIADESNFYFSKPKNAYVVPAGVENWTALVRCVIPGVIGNIQPDTLTRIASTLSGVSKVSNPAPFINGVDNESDASYRARFTSYINSRARGTLLAISNAMHSTSPNISFTIQENRAADGSVLPGNLLIYYDDGTGTPPIGLTNLLQTNVENVRAAGVSFSLAPAFVVIVSVFLSTTFAPGYNKRELIGPMAIAIETYINSIPVGEDLIYTKLYQVIYDAVPGLVDAYGLLINGVAQDLAIGLNQVARFIPATRAGGPGSTMTID